MRHLTANITVNGKHYYKADGENYPLVTAIAREVVGVIRTHGHPMCKSNVVGGQKISLNIEVTFECLLNRRASRRAPEVIAAEKAAWAEKARVRAAASVAAEERWRKERERISLQRRQRIANQIDHAFKSGSESGSEPVPKFVTCQECDAPATLLQLNRSVPSGAAVLDESTVMGAVCAQHNNTNPHYNQYYGLAEHFPVARLEFFYTGIRQIGIKEKP